VSGAENVLEDPEASSSMVLVVAAGNCVKIEDGTVKVCCPAVVVQVNVVVVVTPEVVELEDPTISKKSVGFPPVQLSVSGWLRTTVAGKPPVTTRGAPTVTDAVNLPTSLPPAPFNV